MNVPRLWPVLALALLAGCGLSAPTMRPDDVVGRLERTFPTLRDLEVGVYYRDGDCEYFAYSRGHFTSKPEDQYCRVFVDARFFMNPPVPVAFDAQAKSDLATVKKAFEDVGLTVIYLNLGFSIGISGATNAFHVDMCDSFFYQPGWRQLPEDPDAVVTGVNPEWYVVDSCTRPPREAP